MHRSRGAAPASPIATCSTKRTPAVTVRTCIRPIPPDNTAKARSIRRGPGWDRNLREQFERRKRQGFHYVELDNPDAYRWSDVREAYDLAASYGFKVIAKNPVICENGLAMMQHPAVVGAIVERGCGTPDEMAILRNRAAKPDLPVWFVYWGEGYDDAVECARLATLYRNMGVTYSAGPKEYSGSKDLLRPRI